MHGFVKSPLKSNILRNLINLGVVFSFEMPEEGKGEI